MKAMHEVELDELRKDRNRVEVKLISLILIIYDNENLFDLFSYIYITSNSILQCWLNRTSIEILALDWKKGFVN